MIALVWHHAETGVTIKGTLVERERRATYSGGTMASASTVAGGVLILSAGVAGILGVLRWQRANRMVAWPRVQGAIVRRESESWSTSDDTSSSCRTTIVYQYEVAGTQYEGTEEILATKLTDADVEFEKVKYAVGLPIEVTYCPENAAISNVLPNPATRAVDLFAAAGILLLAGLFILRS